MGVVRSEEGEGGFGLTHKQRLTLNNNSFILLNNYLDRIPSLAQRDNNYTFA